MMPPANTQSPWRSNADILRIDACTHQALSYTQSARKQSDTKFYHVEALQLSFKNILQIENLTGFDSLTKLQVFLPVPSALKGTLCISAKQPGRALPKSCMSGVDISA